MDSAKALFVTNSNGGLTKLSPAAQEMREALALSGCLGSEFNTQLGPVSSGISRHQSTQTYGLQNHNYRPPARVRFAPPRPQTMPPPRPDDQHSGPGPSPSQPRLYDLNQTIEHRPLARAFVRRVRRDLITAGQAAGQAAQSTAAAAQSAVALARRQMGI